jgi:ACT domain.
MLEKLSLEDEHKVISLLEDFRKTNEPKVEIDYNKKVFTIYIIAKDWAGIMDAVLGIFHDEGFNIHFAYAFATENDEAIIVLKIKNLNENEIIRLEQNRNKFLNLLKTAIKGGLSLTKLLNIGTKKIKIYNEIMDKLKELATEEEYKDIISENGELIKFVLSRSEQYLSERKIEDLAYIVYKSYKLQKEFLKTKNVQIDIHNFITKRERLTGLTIVGYYENVSLDDVLDALKEVVGNYHRKFDKEFITDEGIIVIRLEITDEDETSYQKINILLF